MTLPLVDLLDDHRAGAAIDAAFADHGFLQLANIGLAPAELDAVFAESEAFFRAPAEWKRRFLYRSAAENFGFQGLGEENLDPDAPPDVKETFTMRNIMRAPPPDERWPSERFRDVMRGFYARALAAAHDIQRRMAIALDEPETFFSRAHSGENVTLRLLYYPQTAPSPVSPAQLGAGAHTDYGFITLLFQRGVGGLQVIDRNGAWIDVPPSPGAVVVNSGDLLERWTNGRYRSTLHRVSTRPGGPDRFSIAMFIDPDSDTSVAALPSCVSADNPARHGPISAGAHVQAKIAATHKGRFAQ